MKGLGTLPAVRRLNGFVGAALLIGPVVSCSSSDMPDMSSRDAGQAGNGEDVQVSKDSGIILTPGADDGLNHCSGATLAPGALCPTKTLQSLTVIGTEYSVTGSSIAYGTGTDLWNIFALAGSGQMMPSLQPTSGALTISASVAPAPAGQNWVAVGASIDGSLCVETRNVSRGVIFTLSGDLGGCLLYLDTVESQDESVGADPCRGACTMGSMCFQPTVQIGEMGMLTIPNMSFNPGGSDYTENTNKLIGYRWRLLTPDANTSCAAHVTISDVRIFGI